MKQDLNIETGKITKSDFTNEEIVENEKEAAKNLIQYEAKIAIEATKAAEKTALLAKLGITEEEAQLLLGGN